MIKIRYADLPGGLYAKVEARGRDTVIYLLPGLTAAQRRTALLRVRSGARMGKCPRLPAAGVARARVADWARTRTANAVAVVRLHPFTAVPSIVIILSMAIAVALWTPLSTRVMQRPATGPRASLNNPPAAMSGPPPAISGGLERDSGGATAGHPRPTRSARASMPSVAVKTKHRLSPAESATPGQTSPAGGPMATPSASSSASPSPSAAPSPSPDQVPSAGGVCLDLGLFSICL